jgi:Ca2+:H+ antiporter
MGILRSGWAQIALFIAPVLVFGSFVLGRAPMDLQFWPGAIVVMLMATVTAAFVTNSGQSAWFLGLQLLMAYAVFAMTLYLLRRSSTASKVARQPMASPTSTRRSEPAARAPT